MFVIAATHIDILGKTYECTANVGVRNGELVVIDAYVFVTTVETINARRQCEMAGKGYISARNDKGEHTFTHTVLIGKDTIIAIAHTLFHSTCSRQAVALESYFSLYAFAQFYGVGYGRFRLLGGTGFFFGVCTEGQFTDVKRKIARLYLGAALFGLLRLRLNGGV